MGPPDAAFAIPEADGVEGEDGVDHSREPRGPVVRPVARGNVPELLRAPDRTLDAVPAPRLVRVQCGI